MTPKGGNCYHGYALTCILANPALLLTSDNKLGQTARNPAGQLIQRKTWKRARAAALDLFADVDEYRRVVIDLNQQRVIEYDADAIKDTPLSAFKRLTVDRLRLFYLHAGYAMIEDGKSRVVFVKPVAASAAARDKAA